MKKISVTRAVGRSAPMVIKAVPGMCTIYIVLTILHAITHGIAAPVAQRLYDALADLALGGGALRYVYIGAALVAGLALSTQILNATHNLFYEVLTGKAEGRLSGVLHKKMALLPAQLFEDKDRLDDIEKATPGKDGAIHMYATVSDTVFFYGTYFTVMGAFLWSLRPVLIVALVLVFVPEMFSQMVQAKIMAKLEEEQAPVRRQNAHYEDCIIGGAMLKETRLFGAYYFFNKLFMDSLALLAQKEWGAQKKIAAINFGLNAVKAAGWAGILTLLFVSLSQGYIGIGAFAAVFSSIGMLFGIMSEVMNRIKWAVSDNLGKINNFLNVLDIPTPRLAKNTPDFNQPLVAADISFAYPKAEKLAVDGVSLTVRPGETLALVGENGSGKTTLVKLLCGVYKPETGTVTIGGCDTASTDEGTLFAKTTAVFQWPVWHPFTVAGNVQISDVAAGGDALPAINNAGIDLNDTETYPKGIHTVLIREFDDGVQLSGGQWQRIGTARGLYRGHEFIVLDEPTSAIDPIEETRMYNRFAELARGKMAIIVTHRLGSVKIADRIAVMDAGKIVETGTHETLLAAKGKYAEMWAAQAEGYALA